MAECNIQTLLTAANCFATLTAGQQQWVQLQLLCDIEDAVDGIEASLTTLIAQGAVPSLSASAAAEASRVVKATAGSLFTVGMFNNNGATRYLQGFQAAALPANGAVPVFSIPVAAGATVFQLFGDLGLTFATGIVLANSSTATTLTVGGADSLFTASYR